MNQLTTIAALPTTAGLGSQLRAEVHEAAPVKREAMTWIKAARLQAYRELARDIEAAFPPRVSNFEKVCQAAGPRWEAQAVARAEQDAATLARLQDKAIKGVWSGSFPGSQYRLLHETTEFPRCTCGEPDMDFMHHVDRPCHTVEPTYAAFPILSGPEKLLLRDIRTMAPQYASKRIPADATFSERCELMRLMGLVYNVTTDAFVWGPEPAWLAD